MGSDTMITTTATYRSARGTGAGSGRGPRSSATRPSPSKSRTVRDSGGGGSVPVLWVYDKETKKELVRATPLDDTTITFGSMVQFPDPLHGGAYPSVTVYDYRHDEDRVRLQLNDTGVLEAYLPYDPPDR